MELTIHVSEELLNRAQAQGLAPEALAEQWVELQLESTRRPSLAQVQQAVREIREIQSRNTLGGLKIKDLIAEGRKY